MSSALLSAIGLALYIAAAVCYGAVLFLDAPAAPTLARSKGAAPPIARYGRILLLLGILVQFAAIGVLCVQTHRSPFASEYGTLSISAWGLALVYAILDFRVKLPALGAVSLLTACLM